jgi:hypothetical protein
MLLSVAVSASAERRLSRQSALKAAEFLPFLRDCLVRLPSPIIQKVDLVVLLLLRSYRLAQRAILGNVYVICTRQKVESNNGEESPWAWRESYQALNLRISHIF